MAGPGDVRPYVRRYKRTKQAEQNDWRIVWANHLGKRLSKEES
jgi:hypothetical protein